MSGPDNIVIWHGVTRHDLPVNRILDAAKEANLESVVIMGYQDGEFYFASSLADGGDVLWLMRNCEKRLLEIEIPSSPRGAA